MLFYMITGAPPTQHPKQVDISEDLFPKIGQGDMEAFETLYLSTERTIYSFILSLVKNSNDTLDLVQDTYLKIRRSSHLYKPMGKPLAWMFTVARNLCMDFFRKEKREISQDYETLESNLDYSYIEDPTDNLILQSAFEILEEDERQIVLLFAVSGLKHKEIAESLDIPLSTELSRYHRALKKLRDFLVEQEAV